MRDRDVIILADNDEPGRKHAEKKAALFAKTAKRVRVLHFPETPERGDVTDWLVSHGGRSSSCGSGLNRRRHGRRGPSRETRPEQTKTSCSRSSTHGRITQSRRSRSISCRPSSGSSCSKTAASSGAIRARSQCASWAPAARR